MVWPREAAWMVGAWVVAAAVFFREQWTSGFTKLQGNGGDTRLVVYLCEHWFQVLHGQASWQNPSFFYPTKALLGWSDGFLLYQVFYAPLRLLGCDPFIALQVTVILLSLIGFMAFVTFVRTAFGAGRVVAGLGGVIFVFGNALFLHSGSPQLIGVCLVPLVLLVGLQSWRLARTHPLHSAALAALFGLLWALMFFTSYYVAWFSTLAGCIIVAVWFLAGPRRFAAQVRAALVERGRSAGAAGVVFGAGLIPFLLTYLPARHDGAGTTYAAAFAYAGTLHDLVNVGTGNLVWSGLIRHAAPVVPLGAYEQSYAVTPLVMLMALAGGALAAYRLITRSAARPDAARAATILVIATVVFALLPIQIGTHSPWVFIYHLPGASAMRAIFRLEVVTGLLATLTIVAAASDLSVSLAARPKAIYLRLAGVALLVIGVVEQVNTTPVSLVNDSAQTALLRQVTSPPRTCRSFYVVDTANSTMPFVFYQVDAMLISQKVSLPTINGYTGYNPRGWSLEYVRASDYQQNVAEWAARQGVSSGLCRLDLAGMTWDQNPLVRVNSDGG